MTHLAYEVNVTPAGRVTIGLTLPTEEAAMRDIYFDLDDFFRVLEIPKKEQRLVTKCFTDGVETYYQFIYGYNKYGRQPEFLIGERMGEPYIFGFGCVRVVRQPKLSLETRVKVVRYMLADMQPPEEYGTPHGLPAVVSFLAGAGVLEPPLFRSLMFFADIESHNLFEDWETDEAIMLSDWVIAKADIPRSERLWWLWYIGVHCEAHHIGRKVVQYWMGHPALPTADKRTLCFSWLEEDAPIEPPDEWLALEAELFGEMPGDPAELLSSPPDALPELAPDDEPPDFMPSINFLRYALVGGARGFILTPAYCKRQALKALPLLGEDALTLCETYLDSDRDYTADSVNLGVADVLREHHATLPPAAVRNLIERGTRIGKVATRKGFYRLGADLIGPEYWERARADNAKSIRTWAIKQVARRDRQGRKQKQTAS